MIQAAIIIGTWLATTGLIGAGTGIGVVFAPLILGVAINRSLTVPLFSCAILGFAFYLGKRLFLPQTGCQNLNLHLHPTYIDALILITDVLV